MYVMFAHCCTGENGRFFTCNVPSVSVRPFVWEFLPPFVVLRCCPRSELLGMHSALLLATDIGFPRPAHRGRVSRVLSLPYPSDAAVT